MRMEFSPLQIARLVLGYLKTERCLTSFDSFYNTSPHFEQSIKNKVRPKYIVTRVQGYSLRDFLNEYAQMYNLVQERLELTNYYEEHSSRNILDQLKYLLNNFCETRCSTPLRSRSNTPARDLNKDKSIFQQNLSIIQEDVIPELNATPLESLPGNCHEFVRMSRKRDGIKTNKNTIVGESDSGESPDHCEEEEGEKDVEVLKQTLLEHTELHEKIAENINLVINPSSAEEKVNNELESAIKAIVEKTEADPIFQKLITDLISSADESDGVHRSNPEENYLQTAESGQILYEARQTLNKDRETEPETIKQRLRSPKKQPSDNVQENPNVVDTLKTPPAENIPNHNEDPQKCANTKQTENVSSSSVDVHKNLTINTTTAAGDIIVYDGTFDNYMKTSTTSVINPANSIFFNNNLLMVQPSFIQPTSTIATPIISGVPVDKSYYLLNNSQLINVSVPQSKSNNVTEQDILNMPTVIVCDDNQRASNRTTRSASKAPIKILPKQTSESSLREYLTLYQCSDDQSPLKSKPIPFKPQNKDVPNTHTIEIEILTRSTEAMKEEVSNKNEAQQSDGVPTEKAQSPRPGTPEGDKEIIRKTTPKSGSHVRALNFNLTPGQSSLTRRKLGTTPKSARKKSPNKISATKISKTLFGSPSKQVKVENSEVKHEPKEVDKADKTNGATSKSLGSWDADLRALMGSVKPSSPVKKKKKGPAKKKTKRPDLNETEADAKAIEENLKQMDLEVDATPTTETKSEAPEELPNDAMKEITKEEIAEESTDKTENDGDQSVITVTLINCNAKPRFKKKCNIDNNINKAVKITKVTEIKSLEIVSDGSNKLILSPSKLNANKRTLVDNNEKDVNLVVAPLSETPVISTQEIMESKIEVENTEVVRSDETISAASTNESIKSEDMKHTIINVETEKHNTIIVTPELFRIANTLPVTANRNLIPALETPMKFIDTSMKIDELPKTPGTYSPSNDINTPITKLLQEQLRGVDLLSIQTPKFPLTPTFPFTPFNTKSPYPNRSTDYSSTSSYYHPSDSEQNKSLEVLMEECRRLENKKPTPQKEVNLSPPEIPIQPPINEKISSFNQGVIARKNLSLVKNDLEESSSSESSSSDEECSSCTRSDTSSSDSIFDSKNDTVVRKRSETPYMLRSRKKDEKEDAKNIKPIPEIATSPETKTRLEQTTLSPKETLIKEIEEKRKRTKNVKTTSEIATSPETKTRLEQTALSSKETLIKEIEEKRKRTKNVKTIPEIATSPETKTRLEQTALSSKETLPKESEEKRKRTKNVKTIPEIGTNPETKARLEQTTLSSKEILLKEIEEKRKRTVAMFKQGEKPPPKKRRPAVRKTTPTAIRDPPPRNAHGKFISKSKKPSQKSDTLEDKNGKSVNKRKSKSPVKLTQKKAINRDALDERDGLYIVSDDDCIRPLDVVETELLENSSSPTTQPVTTFQNALDSLKSNKKVKESNDVTSDQEAKILVEGLKERGIYLVPKKTPKKAVPSENLNIEQVENGNIETSNAGNGSKNVEGRKGSSAEKPVDKVGIDIKSQLQNSETTSKTEVQELSQNEKNINIDTKGDDKLKNQTSSENTMVSSTNKKAGNKPKRKLEVVKTNDVQNTVLKEGEILNRENVKFEPEHKNRRRPNQATAKSSKKQAKTSETKPANPKSLSNSTKSRSKKPPIEDGNKIIENKETMKTALDENKDNQSHHLNKSISTKSATETKNVPAPATDESINTIRPVQSSIEQDLNLTDSVIDEVFDKFYSEETIGIVYDPKKTSGRTLNDYSLPISNKCVVVEVDGQQIEMTNSPFEMIFDSSGKKPNEKVKILQNTIIAVGKNTLDKSQKHTNIDTTSPLDNLYPDLSSTSYSANNMKRIKSNERRRNSVDHRREPKPKRKTQTRSKSVDCNALRPLSEIEESSERANTSKEEGNNVERERSTKSNEKDVVIRDVDGSPPLTKPSPKAIDDDLMNYAICGSERVENDLEEKSSNKRKAKEDMNEAPVKKMKTQDFLNAVNLDMFLEKLHG